MKKKTMNYTSKLVFILCVSLFLIVPLVSAADIERNIQQHDTVDLKFYCQENDGTDCSTGASCALSLNNPDGTLFVNGVNMTNQGTFHNLTTSFSNLGDYTGKMVCIDSPASGVASVLITVTPTGQTGQTGYYFLIILLSYGVVLFGVWKKDITITMLGTFALYFVGLWVLFFGIDIYKNWLTNAFAIITLGVAAYLSVVMAQEYL